MGARFRFGSAFLMLALLLASPICACAFEVSEFQHSCCPKPASPAENHAKASCVCAEPAKKMYAAPVSFADDGALLADASATAVAPVLRAEPIEGVRHIPDSSHRFLSFHQLLI